MTDSDDAAGSSDAFLREAARIDDVPSSERAAGARVGHFVLREELGRGGMGIVYRAVDDTLGRTVALKVLPAHKESDPQRRARFLREARSAASIDHPNAAAVHEIGEADGSLFIAMELVDGESLRVRLAPKRPLPVEDVVRIAKGIARGLVAAHEKGIVHRDLKPENVMIGADGEPKILDFGLAKLRGDDVPREVLEHQPTEAVTTEEGRMLGTPAYMSPEQAAGKPVDARSDLFSLGVVLYEALSGKRPFAGGTSFETLASVMRDTPTPLRQPPELAAIVMKCLAKTPADRPESAFELLALLDRMGHPKRRFGLPIALVAGVLALGVTLRMILHRPNVETPITPLPTASIPAIQPTTAPSAEPSTSTVPSSNVPAAKSAARTAPIPSKKPVRDPLGDQN